MPKRLVTQDHPPDEQYKTSVVFDPDVLLATDTYILELRRQGVATDRSSLVNAALLFYLQHARKELAHA